LNNKEDCGSANFEDYKKSDITKLGAGAKILIALIKGQPLKRIDLCKNTGIDESTFNRYKRFLLNERIIKKTPKGYCLYGFNDLSSYWDRVQKNCLEAGGSLIDLKAQKLELGDQNPISGHYETNYNPISIQGIMIHRGAIELKAAASVLIPDAYSAFLLTQASILEGDRLSWRDDLYEVKDLEEIFDGNELSFRIAKLVLIPK